MCRFKPQCQKAPMKTNGKEQDSRGSDHIQSKHKNKILEVPIIFNLNRSQVKPSPVVHRPASHPEISQSN